MNGARKLVVGMIGATVAGTAIGLAGSARAAEPAPEPQNVEAAATSEFPGIAWGSFLAFPSLTLSTTYDDNIYAERPYAAERRHVTGDIVYTLSPSIRLRSRWPRHALNLDAGGDLDRYRKYDSENVSDYWIGGDGRYDLGAGSNVFGGWRLTHDHDDRSSPGNEVSQIEPVVFDHEEAHLGLAHAVGNFRLRLGGTYDRFRYESGLLPGGQVVDNSFRDRSMSTMGFRLGYALPPAYEVFGQLATDDRHYDHPISGQTFNRDSRGMRRALGVKFNFVPQRLSGEIFAGLMRQNFSYDGFADIDRPYYSLLARWAPDSRLTVSAFADRTIGETTVTDDVGYASSSTDTSYGVTVERRITGRLSLNGRASYTLSQFNGFDRRDRIVDFGAGLRYYLTPTVYFATDLRVIDRNSTDPGAQYSRNQVLLSLGYTPARNPDYRLAPANDDERTPGLRSPGLYSGFYVGAHAGRAGLTTATSGTRGDGEGTDSADMGGMGAGNGLFLGWGTTIDNWYLGIELEATDSDAAWYHSKNKPDSITEWVARNRGRALSLRAGRVLDGGLLYGRVGRARTEFDSYFTENQFADIDAFDDTRTQQGTLLGFGLEIPATRNLFVRFDYSRTSYDSYLAPHAISAEGTTASETMKNKESVFSVGLGWRFGGKGPTVTERPADGLRGWYMGAGLGRGDIATSMTGTHLDGGGLGGPFDFAGDFAQSGFLGSVFAGFGHTFRRAYVGLELNVDAANFGWEHERTTGGGGGRDFAVDRRGSYGASLRVGYVLPNGALVFASAGPVHARFNTLYNKGASVDSWINRSDTLSGTRIGIGAEIPASDNTFVRVNYSYTRYDNQVDILTSHAGGANADAISFATREASARLSFGYRF